MQAIDECDRKRAAPKQARRPAWGKECVAGLGEDMRLCLERMKHGRVRIDSDGDGGGAQKSERGALIDTDLDYRLWRQRAVQPFKPNQITVARHPQPGKAKMSLRQVSIESQCRPVIQGRRLVLAEHAVGLGEREM